MKKIVLAGILICIVFAWACNSEYPGFRKTDGGLYYKFHVTNKSAIRPSAGDILTVLMTYRTPDSIIFSSSDIPEPFRFPLDEPAFQGDIFEGLAMMHLGDSATFIVSADSLKVYGDLPMNLREAVVYFDVKLLSVQRKAEFEKEKERMQATERKALEKMQAVEDEAIAQYISDNNIRIQPSSSGLYVRWIKKGRGGFAVSGQVVEIHYKARFLDGEKIFASRDEAGESIFFELGSGFEIAAVEEALLLMNPGSHASLIVPSKLAYGNSGIRGAVPPYSPLLFDLELVAVYDKQAYKGKMEQLEILKISEYLKKTN
jgi:FKBP-type peptidyl-prolyl cis-trans isomerase FkpA